MLRVVSPYSFPVLPLPWEAKPGQRMLTVVVKATFRLVPGGEAVLADAQDPLGGDQPWQGDARAALFRPTDWVPFKPRADVLLAGHAHAPRRAPVEALVARLACGGVDKSVRVIGDRAPGGRPAPFVTMPLRDDRAALSAENPLGTTAPPNLEPASPGAWPTFGPLHPQCDARRRRVDDAGFQWAYRLAGPAPEGFDFEFFNAAPAEQRLARIPPGTALRLENLHPEHAVLETRLPDARPRALLDRRELELVADTLWIDADRGLAAISWRGAQAVDAAFLAEGTLEIAVARVEAPRASPAERPFVRTVSLSADEATLVGATPFVEPSAANPPPSAAAPGPRRRPRSPFAATIEAPPDEAAARPATPFEATPSAVNPFAATLPGGPAAFDPRRTVDAPPDTARGPSTPFVGGPSPLSAGAARRPKPPPAFTGTIVDERGPAFAPLPFPVGPSEPPAAPFPPAPPTIMSVAMAPAPIPPAPIPPAPIPPAPPPAPERLDDPRTQLLPARIYAAVKSSLWAGDRSRAEVLRGHGLDEGAWLLQERLWAEALASDARTGRSERSLALASALQGGSARRLSLESYVALRVRVERAPDPARLFEDEGLAAADWDRIHRGFLKRARAEAELRDRLAALLYAARAQAAASDALMKA
jgi:hypothetical protein